VDSSHTCMVTFLSRRACLDVMTRLVLPVRS
jgi:hypothetical protein